MSFASVCGSFFKSKLLKLLKRIYVHLAQNNVVLHYAIMYGNIRAWVFDPLEPVPQAFFHLSVILKDIEVDGTSLLKLSIRHVELVAGFVLERNIGEILAARSLLK